MLLLLQKSLRDVTKIDIGGCIHLTDVGIHWLAQMLQFCPSLKKVII